ncbi:MAG: hypothetical protein IT328_01775 [Caldilineaceae bacterium]|nr:hypothetical protein [Caldilineaceae bacterium]
MPNYFIRDHALVSTDQPPAGAQPLAQLGASLLPPIVTELHRSLQAWGTLGKRPGLLTAERTWATPDGTLIVYFEAGEAPYPLLHVGMALDIASWLVLLDKWMDTFVIVARARTVWTPNELAGAMIFVNPMWLPNALVAQPPNNWLRVVQALAVALADGPLRGKPTTTPHRQRKKQDTGQGQEQDQEQDQHKEIEP